MVERDKRNATFDEDNSVPVVFADDHAWFVPKPWLVIRPRFENGVAVSAWRFLTYGDKLDLLIDAIGEAEDGEAQISGVATLAAYMLRYNYDLSDAELDGLLAFRVGDTASVGWVERVIEIATGRSGPKAVRAGGG